MKSVHTTRKNVGLIETFMMCGVCTVHHGMWGFPGGSVVKHLPASTGDVGLIPGLGRSPAAGNGNRLLYSCLGNPMDRGVWQATGRGLTKDLMTKTTANSVCVIVFKYFSVQFCSL